MGIKGAKVEADKVIKVELLNTCECGVQYATNRTLIRIPKIKPYVVEYQLERGRCRECGKRRSSKLSEPDTFGPSQYLQQKVRKLMNKSSKK